MSVDIVGEKRQADAECEGEERGEKHGEYPKNHHDLVVDFE